MHPQVRECPQVADEASARVVTAAEAATGLRLDVRTVKKLLRRGDIPGVVIGSIYRVNAAWYASVTSWPPAQEVA